MANSITQAQAQAIADGFLNKLGSQKGSFKDMSIVGGMLVEGARAFIENATENLDKANSVSTGELSKSLTFVVSKNDFKYVLSVGYAPGSKAAGYYDFVNKGVAGAISNNKGSKGEYKFKNPHPGKRMATLILLWYRKNASKVTTRDVQKYTPQRGEVKGKALRDTIRKVPSLQSLAYATATNIKRTGLRPTRYFDDALKTSFGETFRHAVSIALGAEVKLEIRRINNESKP